MKRFMGAAALLCVVCLGIAGCGGGSTKVVIRQAAYTPAVDAAGLSDYKGKTLYFPPVTNNAGDTTLWSYNSEDRQHYYEATSMLDAYFRDCFAKAFGRIGVQTLATPPPGAQRLRELQLFLNSVTDRKIVFSAALVRPGESSFQKKFTVEAPAAQTTDVAELEKRSYRLVDSAFLAMVTDAEFRKAFLKK